MSRVYVANIAYKVNNRGLHVLSSHPRNGKFLSNSAQTVGHYTLDQKRETGSVDWLYVTEGEKSKLRYDDLSEK